LISSVALPSDFTFIGVHAFFFTVSVFYSPFVSIYTLQPPIGAIRVYPD
jgi:hypothetical protein